MKYKIDIHAQGYEDTSKTVDRPNLNRVTKTDVLEAKSEWCRHNDIDIDSNFEMPFTKITKVST